MISKTLSNFKRLILTGTLAVAVAAGHYGCFVSGLADTGEKSEGSDRGESIERLLKLRNEYRLGIKESDVDFLMSNLHLWDGLVPRVAGQKLSGAESRVVDEYAKGLIDIFQYQENFPHHLLKETNLKEELLLAAGYTVRGEWEAAKTVSSEILEQCDTSPTGLRFAGISRLLAGELDSAEYYFFRLLDEEPTTFLRSTTYSNLANIHLRRGRTNLASNYLDFAISSAKNNGWLLEHSIALNSLGSAKLQEGLYAEADSLFREAANVRAIGAPSQVLNVSFLGNSIYCALLQRPGEARLRSLIDSMSSIIDSTKKLANAMPNLNMHPNRSIGKFYDNMSMAHLQLAQIELRNYAEGKSTKLPCGATASAIDYTVRADSSASQTRDESGRLENLLRLSQILVDSTCNEIRALKRVEKADKSRLLSIIDKSFNFDSSLVAAQLEDDPRELGKLVLDSIATCANDQMLYPLVAEACSFYASIEKDPKAKIQKLTDEFVARMNMRTYGDAQLVVEQIGHSISQAQVTLLSPEDTSLRDAKAFVKSKLNANKHMMSSSYAGEYLSSLLGSYLEQIPDGIHGSSTVDGRD